MYQCVFCGTNYNTSAQLHQHNLDTHSQELPFRLDYIYICQHPQCHVVTKNGISIKSHYEIDHGNNKATQTSSNTNQSKELFVGIQIDDLKRLIGCATPSTEIEGSHQKDTENKKQKKSKK